MKDITRKLCSKIFDNHDKIEYNPTYVPLMTSGVSIDPDTFETKPIDLLKSFGITTRYGLTMTVFPQPQGGAIIVTGKIK